MDPQSIITFKPYVHMEQNTDMTYPCTCNNIPKVQSVVTSSSTSTSTTTDTSVTIGCTQPPPGATVQIEVPSGSANAIICTQQPLQSDSVFRINGMQVPLGIHSDQPNVSGQAFVTGTNGFLGVLVLLAVGSTLWYRRKYQQAIKTKTL